MDMFYIPDSNHKLLQFLDDRGANITPRNGRLVDDPFLSGFNLFSGALAIKRTSFLKTLISVWAKNKTVHFLFWKHLAKTFVRLDIRDQYHQQKHSKRNEKNNEQTSHQPYNFKVVRVLSWERISGYPHHATSGNSQPQTGIVKGQRWVVKLRTPP